MKNFWCSTKFFVYNPVLPSISVFCLRYLVDAVQVTIDYFSVLTPGFLFFKLTETIEFVEA